MNRKECANCLVHGWKQPEDKNLLLQCQNCKLILYCGKECQLEHWIKVHRRHCEYFKDPSKNEPWQHKAKDCLICLQTAVVGEARLAQANNPNYDCIFKIEFPKTLFHPHPFPVTGQPGDIHEKAIIVLWQLVRKFQLTHPKVAQVCHEEFLAVKCTLVGERIAIWKDRKIYPQPQAQCYDCDLLAELSDIEVKMIRMKTLEDPFQSWKIIGLIERIVSSVKLNNEIKFLKDPLSNLPDDIRKLVSEVMDNTTKYVAVADKVLEALTTQLIPYEEIVKIIGGGSLEQICSFCSKEMDISSEESTIFFIPLLLGKYSCGRQDCQAKGVAAMDDQSRFEAALTLMWMERKANVCDFCFERTPFKQKGSDMRDIHRCRHCRTTMYCSRDCLYQDDKIHVKVCQKDKDGRKKKPRGSARRKVAREEIERIEKNTDFSEDFGDILDKFKLKNAKKDPKN